LALPVDRTPNFLEIVGSHPLPDYPEHPQAWRRIDALPNLPCHCYSAGVLTEALERQELQTHWAPEGLHLVEAHLVDHCPVAQDLIPCGDCKHSSINFRGECGLNLPSRTALLTLKPGTQTVEVEDMATRELFWGRVWSFSRGSRRLWLWAWRLLPSICTPST
jgi:hypothetical protein